VAYKLSPYRTRTAIRPTTSLSLIRARAPLRISFAGGGTDLPSYYQEHGGTVLCSTINRYASVTLVPRHDQQVHICSLDFDLIVKYGLDEEPIYDGALDLAKAAIARLNGRPSGDGGDGRLAGGRGLDLYLQSDAPPGSGMGGSASMTIAVIGVLAEMAGRRLDKYDMAELAYAVERSDLGISGGRQDQYTTAFGGFNLIEFSKERVVVNPLRIDRDVLNDLEEHLMLCYTGGTRFSAGLIDKQEGLYREGRVETLEGLGELRRIAYAMKDALLTANLREFGALLDVAWKSKQRANPDITDETITEMYETARRSGASGGKLLGAGGGGYLLLFCEVGRRRDVREKLERMGGQFTDFAFREDGLQVWRSACP
jgi:D-glycero-alpha-D-manno-heptose-7-phosphate kinase